jgi:hypothetical protein
VTVQLAFNSDAVGKLNPDGNEKVEIEPEPEPVVPSLPEAWVEEVPDESSDY